MPKKVKLPRVAKGKNLVYLDDSSIDNILAMVMTLTQEISVLTDRLDTVENLMANKGQINRDDIDSFEPDDELQEKRTERRKTLLKRVLLPIEKALDSK
ncbi:MAG: hypothetical protein P8M55_00340 [Gammaproteobacteria bacterium]|jgi:hypothetical protein|nr:hypothetical protein [Gammaproteobacteria bacterium]